MAEAHSLPLLSQYSDVFTRLHEGRLQCARYGIDKVALNRFIIDSAESTATGDPSGLISMVDPDKVEGDDNVEEKLARCEREVLELVALQEEVNTLQKVAREKGISGGLLRIVGQASIQSPSDNGASVIHQLSALMGGDTITANAAPAPGNEVTESVAAANDEEESAEHDTGEFTRWQQMLKDNWQTIGIDVLVCLAASLFAVRLVS